jgi:ribosomal protein S2
MAITGNGIKIIADFKQGNFKKYETAFMERQKAILQNSDAPIKKLSVIPNTFTIVDVREDSNWWVDKCMRKYYNTIR